MENFKNLPIIMCSMSRWDSPLSSAAYSLAKELSKTNQVFYFDYPYTIKDYFVEKHTPEVTRRKAALLKGKDIYTSVPGLGENFKAVTPKAMLPFYFLPPGPVYDQVLKINNKRFFKTVKQILKDYGFTDYIFWNSFCPFYGFEIPKGFSPTYFVYQSRDDLRAIPELANHGPKYERIAAKNADLVITTSTRLHEILEAESGREVHLLPNAAHTSLFRKTVEETDERPNDFPEKGRKVVGYIGNIGPRMDMDLMDKLLKAYADVDFVMIGPDNISQYGGEELKKYKNLHFLGSKKLEQLPDYLRYMDATIIPFVKDAQTASIYPLKLNEQLAAGRAIVTTNFSKDVQHFEDVVYVSENHEDFIGKVNKAIHDNSEEAISTRVKKSEGNAWSDRVNLFWELLGNSKRKK